jgi:hypothetical protein
LSVPLPEKSGLGGGRLRQAQEDGGEGGRADGECLVMPVAGARQALRPIGQPTSEQ